MSITRWVARFFAIAGLALLVMGGYGLYQLSRLDDEIAANRSGAAKEEITSAVAALQQAVQRQALALATWDETRQQLVNPDYYGYWKSSRVHHAGLIKNFFQDFDLYNPDGSPLPGNTEGKLLGKPVSPEGISLYVPDKGMERITHIVPVFTDESNAVLLGYMQLEFDFVQALEQTRSFSTLDPASIKTSYQGAPLPLQQLPSHLQFRISPPSELTTLKSGMINAYLALVVVILLSALAAYIAMQRKLARPLVELAKAIDNIKPDEIQLEHIDKLAMPMPLHELDTVRHAVQTFRQKLGDARIALENSSQAFQRQARQDALTGTFNRRAFEQDWETLTNKPGRQAIPLALLLFDCDHFKPINDTYGHHVGDRVLQIIADSVSRVLRSGDRLYRIGGDEFITLLKSADEETAMDIAKRCLDSVRAQNFKELGIKEPVGISIGIALGTVSTTADLTRLQARADAAMYQAKRPGSLKIALYREHENTPDDALLGSLEANALYQALANPELLELHFQRMQPCGDGAVYMEVLSRIRHDSGLLTPARFMPVVQSRRLEAEFDLVVIRRIGELMQAGNLPVGAGVSVNLSAQSLGRAEVVAQLVELTRYKKAHPLILEITETSLVPRLEEISHHINVLRNGGFKIALDDFGSGYSPLRYLSDMPVDIIKFDMALVHQLQHGGRAGLVVADFVRLMLDAGYTLIAEGIENEAQLEKVRTLGFHFVQGYHIQRPAPLLGLTYPI